MVIFHELSCYDKGKGSVKRKRYLVGIAIYCSIDRKTFSLFYKPYETSTIFYVYDLDLRNQNSLFSFRFIDLQMKFYSLNTIVSIIKYITSSSLDVKIRIEF